MTAKKSYRWRPAPAPWRVGQRDVSDQQTDASSPPAEGGKKSTGTIVLVLVGAATVAFGVMELLGVTKVFAPPPVPLPPGTVLPAGTLPATGTPVIPPLVPAVPLK